MSRYIVEWFDKNHIRPNYQVIVEGVSNKEDAISAARVEFVSRAESDARLVTEGMFSYSADITGKKGTTISATVRRVSPEYYQRLILQNWGIAWVERIDGVSKGVSSDSAVAKADAAFVAAQKACDELVPTESSVERRKKRWTAAEKKAAKARRLAAKAARVAKSAELTIAA